MLAYQAFRQGDEFGSRIGPPNDASVRQQTHYGPAHGATQRLNTVARPKVGCFRKLIYNLGHGFVIEHAGDVMGHRGDYLASAGGREFSEDEVNDSSPYVCERVAVEEEERGAAMALPQEFYGFVEGGDFCLSAPPLCFKRCIAL